MWNLKDCDEEWSEAERQAHSGRMERSARAEARIRGINLDRAGSDCVNGLCDYCGTTATEFHQVAYVGSARVGQHVGYSICAGCSVDAPKRYAPMFDVSTATRLELWYADLDGLSRLMAGNGIVHRKRTRTDVELEDDQDSLESGRRVNIYWRGAANDPERGVEWLTAEHAVWQQAEDAERKREARLYTAAVKCERDRLDTELCRRRLEIVRQSMTYRHLSVVDRKPVFTDVQEFRTLEDALACRDSRRLPLDRELASMFAEGISKKLLASATGYKPKRLNLALERGGACPFTLGQGQGPPEPGEADSSPASSTNLDPLRRALDHTLPTQGHAYDGQRETRAA